VSSALLSLLSYNQINVVLELHHSLTNTTHPFPSPIAPGNLAGDPTAAGARHLAVDRPPRASTGQIGPTSVIPYLRPCLATTPSVKNRATDEEPPRNFTGDRFSPPLQPSSLWRVGQRPRRSPAPFLPSVGRLGRLPARPRSAWPISPPAQLAEKTLFFFLFHFFFLFFLYLCIY
jgi:hypothetical protein